MEIHADTVISLKEIIALLLWSLSDIILSTKGILNERIMNILRNFMK